MSFSCRILNEFSSHLTSSSHTGYPTTLNLHNSPCLRHSDHYTTLYLTCWQVGFDVRSAPPVTLYRLKFPFLAVRLVSQHSFHITCFPPITTALISDSFLTEEVKACLIVPFFTGREMCRTYRISSYCYELLRSSAKPFSHLAFLLNNRFLKLYCIIY